jgi:ABC-type transport system involved in multi-copper enzyme maturation permease subunit
MIRFTWMQARLQTAIAVAGLAIVAIVLVITEPNLVHVYDTTVVTCVADHDCGTATTAFLGTDSTLQNFANFLLLLAPALIGIFWGAPLVAREYETGTFRLAWTQGVTRTRWLNIKLGIGVAASMIVVGLLSLIVTWWSMLLDQVSMDPFSPLGFGVRDITPVGYAAFGFVLGVTAGLLLRRSVPAMVATLVGFVAVREAVTYWVRPNLVAPLHTSIAISSSSPLSVGSVNGQVIVTALTTGIDPNAWVYSSKIVDQTGHSPTTAFLNRACPFGANGLNLQHCISAIAAKFHEVITYQPASAYWAFQWYEAAIFLGLTVVLSGLCIWWIRRPVA